MAFEPPNVTNSATETIRHINDNWVDGFLFPGMIIALYIIIVGKQLSNPQNTFAKSFASASFVCMVLSIFARVLGMVDTWFMTAFIALTAFWAVAVYLSER